MNEPFDTERDDGRSDRRVVFELAEDAEVETLFSYDELIDELSSELPDRVNRDRVYRAVAAANKTLLRERNRYLSVVTNQGYRVIRSDEHLPVAVGKKNRAEAYLHRGMEILQNTDMSELDNTQRNLHEGQLMILGGVVSAMRETRRRQDRVEKVLADLEKKTSDRVSDLENRVDQMERT